MSLAAVALLAGLIAGCGGAGHQATTTASNGTLPPGKVERAAKSNAHKEIPTRFDRAVQLPFRSTVLLVTALRVAKLGERRKLGIVVGIRNIGRTPWSGSPAGLSKLAISRHNAPERVIGATASSQGPCPAPLTPTHVRATRSAVDVQPGRTSFVCVRFSLPGGFKPILYKFAAQGRDYIANPPPPGHGYGVWALPGTLVEACRFAPGTQKGHCHGLEVGED
jgi:hypothetical protein